MMRRDQRGLSLHEIQSLNREVAPSEGKREQWAEHGNDAARFDAVFRKGSYLYERTTLIEYGFLDKPICEVIQERRDQGGTAFALDVMGDGAFLRDLPVEGGVSISLGDVRLPEVQEEDARRNLAVLTGDLATKKIWKELDASLEDHKKSHFDFIFGMPFGGLVHLPKDPEMVFWILDQLYQRLSKENGLLLVQATRYYSSDPYSGFGGEKVPTPESYTKFVPRSDDYPIDTRLFVEWVRYKAQGISGLDIQFNQEGESTDHYLLRIQKGSEAPDHLPGFLPPKRRAG